MTTNQIFKGLKVVELASVLAGPLVGTFFSELGARVIKIENKITGGDVTRNWKVAGEDKTSPVSAYYSSANYGKTIELMDLNDSSDIKRLESHLRSADVVIVNFRKDKAIQFGIDYESVKRMNQNVIYGEISGYGRHDSGIAYDVVLQAETGFMSMTGTEESGPCKMPVAFIDVITAHQMKQGLLCALYKRERTGEGSYVHASLYETAVSSLVNQAGNYLMANHIPRRMGSMHPNLAPYGEIFLTSDSKHIVLAIGSDSQFSSLCQLLKIPGISEDERFKGNPDRVENRSLLYDILSAGINKMDSSSLLQHFEERHIPAGTIKTVDQVFQDKRAMELVLKENIEGVDTKRVRSVVFEIE